VRNAADVINPERAKANTRAEPLVSRCATPVPPERPRFIFRAHHDDGTRRNQRLGASVGVAHNGWHTVETLVKLFVYSGASPHQLCFDPLAIGYWLLAIREAPYINDAPASANALRSPFVRQT
jgi:hypothetical protein